MQHEYFSNVIGTIIAASREQASEKFVEAIAKLEGSPIHDAISASADIQYVGPARLASEPKTPRAASAAPAKRKPTRKANPAKAKVPA